jgi:hypothetical protein
MGQPQAVDGAGVGQAIVRREVRLGEGCLLHSLGQIPADGGDGAAIEGGQRQQLLRFGRFWHGFDGLLRLVNIPFRQIVTLGQVKDARGLQA